MYVVYDIVAGEGLIDVQSRPVGEGYFYHPSECQWIIPGTVDPKDD